MPTATAVMIRIKRINRLANVRQALPGYVVQIAGIEHVVFVLYAQQFNVVSVWHLIKPTLFVHPPMASAIKREKYPNIRNHSYVRLLYIIEL